MADSSVEYDRVIASMVGSLERKLKARDIDYLGKADLKDEIFDAIEAVNDRRRFEATSAIPFETKYKSLIVNLALASITKMGAEGETAHSENGINRSYDSASQYPESLLGTVVPLAKAR